MYDVVSIREYTRKDGSEGTAFSNCGRAFASPNSQNITVILEMLPLTIKDGSLKLLLMPAKSKLEQTAASQPAARAYTSPARTKSPAKPTAVASFGDDEEDQIPF